MPFRLCLFGGASLDGPEGPVTGRAVQRRQIALLALLASAPDGTLRRDKLVAWLWPETGEKRARSLLSDTLYVLRQTLGEEAIETSGETVRLDLDVVESDVAEFRAALDVGDLETAVDLHTASFLDGVDLAGSAELERWIADERARFERRAARAAQERAEALRAGGELERAERYARRALAIEPGDEAAVRVLLRILDQRGDRAGAIRAYESFEERLASDLDVEPAPETVELVTGIRSRDVSNGAIDEIAAPPSSPAPSPPGAPEPVAEDRPRRWLLPAVAVVLVAGGVLLISALFPERPTAIPPAEKGTAIAVLPFAVQGEGFDLWREGMVDVLSANLDGVAGLRVIDSRTVLARWREAVPDEDIPDTPTALEIARRTGARYALLGSVVASKTGMRVVSDLYDLETGRQIGRPGVDGAPDSIFALADRLAIEILQPIVREDSHLSEIDLARATTSSPVALQAFLEAEALYRAGKAREAAPLYRRAIKADSTFGQAYYRLERAYGWTRLPERRGLPEKAYRLVDRLPERDSLLVHGLYAFEAGRPEGLEILRSAVLKYPDDSEAWDLLGDFIYHLGGALLVDPKEGRNALRRAIELDPRFASPYLHTIHNVMRHEPDSARVGALVETYGRLASGTVAARELRVMHGLAFGGDSARSVALAALDTLSGFLPYLAHQNLSHARFLDEKVAVLELARERLSWDEARIAGSMLARSRLARGEIAAAVRAVDHPVLAGARGARDRSMILYLAHVRGYPVPDDRLDLELGALPDDFDVERMFYAGAWALERDRPQVRRRALARLRAAVERVLADGDTIAAEALDGAALALEGLAAWKRNDLDAAERDLERARVLTAVGVGGGPISRIVRWWLAEINLQRGRLERAERYFLSLGHGAAFATDPVAVYRQARVQERLGLTEEAERNHEYFLAAFRDPDPELRSWVDDARAAVVRLQRTRRE